MTDNIVEEMLEQEDQPTPQPETVAEFYQQIRLLVESMESDVLKNDRGNKAAGTRLRKSLRLLKAYSGDFVKFSVKTDRH